MLSLKMFLRKGLNIESKILGRGTLWCSFGYTKSAFSLILDKSPGYLPDNDDEHDNFYDTIAVTRAPRQTLRHMSLLQQSDSLNLPTISRDTCGHKPLLHLNNLLHLLATLTTSMYWDGSSALMYESIASLTIPWLSWALANWLQTAGSLHFSANSYARSKLLMWSIRTYHINNKRTK